MSRSFQPSFFRWALNLPDSEPVRLLHALAREIFRTLGGEAIEEHLAAYAELVSQWRAGGPDRPPLREAMRAMGARERGHARLDKLREQAWLQARAEVFQRTGARIPLPLTPETADRQEDAETVQAMRQIKAQIRQVGTLAQEVEALRPATPASPPTGAPDQAVEDKPLTNVQIKLGIRRLIEAQVDRKLVETLRAEAYAGGMNLVQFASRVVDLLEQKGVA